MAGRVIQTWPEISEAERAYIRGERLRGVFQEMQDDMSFLTRVSFLDKLHMLAVEKKTALRSRWRNAVRVARKRKT